MGGKTNRDCISCSRFNSGRCILRGAKEIGASVGISYKDLGFYIKTEQLPTFKAANRGSWLLLYCDGVAWLWEQRDKYANNNAVKD